MVLLNQRLYCSDADNDNSERAVQELEINIIILQSMEDVRHAPSPGFTDFLRTPLYVPHVPLEGARPRQLTPSRNHLTSSVVYQIDGRDQTIDFEQRAELQKDTCTKKISKQGKYT